MGRWWPCAPCCPVTCLVGSDAFDRADNDNVGDDWIELLGSSSGWKIEDYDLVTDVSNDMILYRKIHPDNVADVRIEVWVKGVAGDVAKVIVSYIDDNNYLWGQVEIGNFGIMTMTLWQKLNGVVTQLGATEHAYFGATSEWVGMVVCRQEDYPIPAWASLTVIGGFGPVTIREDVAAPLSPYVALATGNVVGTIYFYNFTYYMLKTPTRPECPECEPPIDCLYCDTTVAPYVKVTITGVTSFLAGSTVGCIPLNGTWIIPFGEPPLGILRPIIDRCLYYKEFTVGTDVLQFHVGITDRITIANGIVDVVAYRIGWGGLKWSLDAPPVLPSCNEFSVNVPYDGYTSVNCALAIGPFPTCRVLTV